MFDAGKPIGDVNTAPRKPRKENCDIIEMINIIRMNLNEREFECCTEIWFCKDLQYA
jgi:hypothetical protein